MTEVDFDKLAEELYKGWHFTVHLMGVKRGKTREVEWVDDYTVRRVFEFLFGKDEQKVRPPNPRYFSLKMPYGYWTTDALFKSELERLMEKFEAMKADFLFKLRDPEVYKRLMKLSDELGLSAEELIRSIKFKVLPVKYKILDTTDAYKRDIIERFKKSILQRLKDISNGLVLLLGTTKSGRTTRLRTLDKTWRILRQLNLVDWRKKDLDILERAQMAIVSRSSRRFPYDELEAWSQREEDLKLKATLQKLLERAKSPISWRF